MGWDESDSVDGALCCLLRYWDAYAANDAAIDVDVLTRLDSMSRCDCSNTSHIIYSYHRASTNQLEPYARFNRNLSSQAQCKITPGSLPLHNLAYHFPQPDIMKRLHDTEPGGSPAEAHPQTATTTTADCAPQSLLAILKISDGPKSDGLIS
jgi:hypothetical protein